MPAVRIRKEARPRSGPELRRVVPDTNYMERLPTERSLPEISLPKLHDASVEEPNLDRTSPNISPRQNASLEDPHVCMPYAASSQTKVEEDTGAALLHRRSESYKALQKKLEATSQHQEKIREELEAYLVEVRQKLKDVEKSDEEGGEEHRKVTQTPEEPLASKLSQLVLRKSEDLPRDESARLHKGMSKIERLDGILHVVESKLDPSGQPSAVTSTPRRPKVNNLKKQKRRRRKKDRRASQEQESRKIETFREKDDTVDEDDPCKRENTDLEEFAKKTLLTKDEQSRLDRILDEGEDMLLITDGNEFHFGESGLSEQMGEVDKKLRDLLGEEEWQEKLKFIAGKPLKTNGVSSKSNRKRMKASAVTKRK